MFLPTSKINWLTIVLGERERDLEKDNSRVRAKAKEKKKSDQFEYCLSFHQRKNLYRLLKEEKSRFIGSRVKNGDVLIIVLARFYGIIFGIKRNYCTVDNSIINIARHRISFIGMINCLSIRKISQIYMFQFI